MQVTIGKLSSQSRYYKSLDVLESQRESIPIFIGFLKVFLGYLLLSVHCRRLGTPVPRGSIEFPYSSGRSKFLYLGRDSFVYKDYI